MEIDWRNRVVLCSIIIGLFMFAGALYDILLNL
jgi:hypothetical protein